MEQDPRFPRSREAYWEGIPLWTPFLVIFLLMTGCSRRHVYAPTWLPDYWSLQAAAFLTVVVIVSLKLHLTRHRLTLVLVAAQPDVSHYSGPLIYAPPSYDGTAYVYAAPWFPD